MKTSTRTSQDPRIVFSTLCGNQVQRLKKAHSSISSNINEGIKAVLFFSTKRFDTHKMHKKHKTQINNFLPLRCFLYAQKA